MSQTSSSAGNAVEPGIPFRTLCTDCGISRTDDPGRCGYACQFVSPDYAAHETQVHGRPRLELDEGHHDEGHFGVYQDMWRARHEPALPGAQWTGITTALAARLLETGVVDAVVTMAAASDDRWKPEPRIIVSAAELAQCRGMRMGYAPLLETFEKAVIQRGLKRICVIGIPCQVYALRAVQAEYNLEHLIVIGTPCSDNTSTEKFHEFLGLLDDAPDSINYLEFRADYHVELRYENGTQREIPFLKLPLSKLPADFFPVTCRTCVDYTNSLADITVGYMAGEGDQWIIVRNDTGSEVLSTLEDRLQLSTLNSAGKRSSSVAGFKQNVERAAGGLPLRAMPNWLRPLMAWLMPRVGPRGLEFARARLEMKALETVFHLRRLHPKRVKSMVPQHVWRLAGQYGVKPACDERPNATPKPTPKESVV